MKRWWHWHSEMYREDAKVRFYKPSLRCVWGQGLIQQPSSVPEEEDPSADLHMCWAQSCCAGCTASEPERGSPFHVKRMKISSGEESSRGRDFVWQRANRTLCKQASQKGSESGWIVRKDQTEERTEQGNIKWCTGWWAELKWGCFQAYLLLQAHFWARTTGHCLLAVPPRLTWPSPKSLGFGLVLGTRCQYPWDGERAALQGWAATLNEEPVAQSVLRQYPWGIRESYGGKALEFPYMCFVFSSKDTKAVERAPSWEARRCVNYLIRQSLG